jgi:hypothetical protein
MTKSNGENSASEIIIQHLPLSFTGGWSCDISGGVRREYKN